MRMRTMPLKPSPKRKQANPTTSRNDFNACTVHQVSGFMVNGLPATQQAALAVRRPEKVTGVQVMLRKCLVGDH